ncbi:MAG: hypothetical protein HRT44_01325 [Bdellovibrionales bacterium]|nr:hypothetical protein [Bdellovibrionales bacterium]NQZ17888.1 hypothetical protein [Bdellovibrionales bacterium]
MWSLKAKQTSDKAIRSYMEKSYEQLLARTDLGFKDKDLMQLCASECRQLTSFYQGKEKMVVVGLGGSSLGAKALCEALYPTEWQKKMVFLDNVDSDSVDSFLASVDEPKKLGWIIISKSGSTVEVLSLVDYCHNFFESQHNHSVKDNMVVITEEKESPLKNFANQNDVPSLPVPKNVGGRFSVFTAVGLFPLGFMGFDFDKSIVGFNKALENKSLVIDLATQLYSSIGREEYNFYCFHYSDRLTQWAAWLQQLWSESLAKSQDRKGNEGPIVSTLIPCRGASDQHSVLQQVMEGREKKLACFIRTPGSEKGQYKIEKSIMGHDLMMGKNIGALLAAEADATEQALNEAQINTLRLTCEKMDSSEMTQFMVLWMLVVGTLGEAFDINAFNQPGVESGKLIARRVLSGSD